MDAVEKIKSIIDVASVIEYYKFEQIKEHGKYIRACCKVHGGDNSTAFVADTETGLWFCHVCGERGDIFKLVMLLENIEFTLAVRRLAKIFNINIDGLELLMPTADATRSIREFMNIMKKDKREEMVEYDLPSNGRKIAEYRGFDGRILDEFEVKYYEEILINGGDNVSSSILRKRVLFPIRFKGKIIGYSARRTISTEYAKWIHQPREIKTGNILYGFDRCISEIQSGTISGIVVCEGILDVLAYYRIGVLAVATFGASMSEQQSSLLIQTGADIIMSYDADEAGKKGVEKVKKKMGKTTNLYHIEFPFGEDPASISPDELTQLYNKRRRL